MYFGSKKIFDVQNYFFRDRNFFFQENFQNFHKKVSKCRISRIFWKFKIWKFWEIEIFEISRFFFRQKKSKLFFVRASKKYFFRIEIFFRYSFDVEIQALSIYDVFRTIPALLPSIQTALVTKCVSKLKHFDEIRWTGYMGSDR